MRRSSFWICLIIAALACALAPSAALASIPYYGIPGLTGACGTASPGPGTALPCLNFLEPLSTTNVIVSNLTPLFSNGNTESWGFIGQEAVTISQAFSFNFNIWDVFNAIPGTYSQLSDTLTVTLSPGFLGSGGTVTVSFDSSPTQAVICGTTKNCNLLEGPKDTSLQYVDLTDTSAGSFNTDLAVAFNSFPAGNINLPEPGSIVLLLTMLAGVVGVAKLRRV